MPNRSEQLADALQSLLDDPDYRFRKNRVTGGVLNEHDEVDPLKAIQHFRYAIANGVLPDAEALRFIASAFARYVESRPFCSLDEAFNLKSQKGTGLPTNQHIRQETQLIYLADMLAWRTSHPGTTQEDAFRAIYRDWATRDRLVPFTEETGVRYFERYMQNLRAAGAFTAEQS